MNRIASALLAAILIFAATTSASVAPSFWGATAHLGGCVTAYSPTAFPDGSPGCTIYLTVPPALSSTPASGQPFQIYFDPHTAPEVYCPYLRGGDYLDLDAYLETTYGGIDQLARSHVTRVVWYEQRASQCAGIK